jgi:glyoxylase-like metal-dependent hydrolase (beta-lactamase superfamily II)
MTSSKISLGQFTIYGLRDGFFYLDGGAMFGVVPKVLWEKIYPPDSKNRIQMGLNSLLVETPKSLVLVETGIGPELDPKFRKFYSVEQEPGLLSELESLGFHARNVDFVINSHLHFDHCGGNTFRNKEGEVVPAFPNAQYIIQEGDWEYAQEPCYRDKPSYMPETFLPLAEHGCLELVDGDTQVTEGVEVLLAPGHTSHHQCVKISSQNQVLFFLADMVPMSGHVGLSYIMSYDLFPLETLANKKKFFEQAIDEDWTLAFVHDPKFFFGKLARKNDKYIFSPLNISS